MAAANKPSKLQLRLQTAVDDKRFYEAHQLYKTIYFRSLTRRNYSEALKQLISGAEFLLDNQQWESGTDLACLLLEVYAKSKMELTEVHLNQICELLRRMRPGGEERSTYIIKTLELLQPYKELVGGFNVQLARMLWQEGAFGESRHRIMLSGNGYAAGSFLIELHQRYGLRSEIDLFIAQAVLQFLCMREISVAALAFYTYTRGHPRLEHGPPFTRFPLLNFLWFLMLAIERRCNPSVFFVLREKYSVQINRDVSYLKYLDKIGHMYFGTKLPGKDMNNLLNHMVKLFSVPEDDPSNAVDFLQSTSASASHNDHPVCFEDVD